MPVAKSSGGSSEPVPAGTHAARCVSVISLGTQPSNNPAFPPRFKVMIGWELPDETIEHEGKQMPLRISKELTLSLNDKSALKPLLESWRGKPFTADELAGFAVEKLLGAPCLLSVIHKPRPAGGVYSNIASVSKLPKSMQCGAQVHPNEHYEIEDGRNEVFNKLPDWIKSKILVCAEWQTQGKAAHDDSPDTDSGNPFGEEPGETDLDCPF